MINAEWLIPFELSVPDPIGGATIVLPFNQQAYSLASSDPLGWYMLDPAKCSAGTARRVTRTNIAQADGEITHRKFKTGYVMELTMQLWEDPEAEIACGATLVEMIDQLMFFLNAIENADGRIQWTPTGYAGGDRMLDAVRVLGPSGDGQSGFVSVVQSIDENESLVSLTFALITPFPYANDVAIADDPPGTLTNSGNTEYFPSTGTYPGITITASGADVSAFTLANNSNLDEQGNAKQIVFDATLPGGQVIPNGQYAVIDCFRNTIYLNGVVSPANNLKPCINIMESDFWGLLPGANVVALSGDAAAVADIFYTAAYA